MSLTQQDHPFYKPLAVRLAIIAVTGLWSAIEILHLGNGFWSALSVGIFIYCLWTFLLGWKGSDNTSPKA
jgi:hypothetical protein